MSQLVAHNREQTSKMQRLLPKESEGLPGLDREEIDDWEEFARELYH
jgi:hypothetical protein